MEISKTVISSSSFFFFFDLLLLLLLLLNRTTYGLNGTGTETIIHSQNRFTLPWTGTFSQYEATTTLNSSCLMYGYYIVFQRHFTELTHDQGAALTYA